MILQLRYLLKYRYWLDYEDLLYVKDYQKFFRYGQANEIIIKGVEAILDRIIEKCNIYIPELDLLVESKEYISYNDRKLYPIDNNDKRIYNHILKINCVLALLFDMVQKNDNKHEKILLVDYLLRYRKFSHGKEKLQREGDKERGYSKEEFDMALAYRKKQINRKSNAASEDANYYSDMTEETFANADKDERREFLNPYLNHCLHRIRRFNEVCLLENRKSKSNQIKISDTIKERRKPDSYFQYLKSKKNKAIYPFDYEFIGELIANDSLINSIGKMQINGSHVMDIYNGRRKLRNAVLSKIPLKDCKDNKDGLELYRKRLMMELQIERYLNIDLETSLLSWLNIVKKSQFDFRDEFRAMPLLTSYFCGTKWLVERPTKFFLENIILYHESEYTKRTITDRWMEDYINYLYTLEKIVLPLLRGSLEVCLYDFLKENYFADSSESDDRIREQMRECLWQYVFAHIEDIKEVGCEHILKETSEKRKKVAQEDNFEKELYVVENLVEPNCDTLKEIYSKLFPKGWLENRHFDCDDLFWKLDNPEFNKNNTVMHLIAHQIRYMFLE